MPLLAHSPSRNQYAPKSFGGNTIGYIWPRVKRAEHLTDLANAANDKLAALFEAALKELRGK